MLDEPFRVAVLISGRGSNLKTLIDAQADHPFRIVGVASNNVDAAGLEFARVAQIPTTVISHGDFRSREAFDGKMAQAVAAWQPGLVVLAGFMRILSPAFIDPFPGRIINIHPSLLPKYPGLDTHQRALEAGDQWHGATTHFVTPVLDGGPPIARTRIAIRPDDSPEALAARLLPREHQLMVRTVDLIARRAVQCHDDIVYHQGQPLREPLEPDPPLD